MSRIIERRGDQVYVEDFDDWTGKTIYEWRYSPELRCACGQKSYCAEVLQTTFSERYECGYTYHYTNNGFWDDNIIAINDKRVK